jgi:hypothetical protein
MKSSRLLADFALTTLTLPRALALSICHGHQSGSGSSFSEASASTSSASSASCLAGTTQPSRVSCHFAKGKSLPAKRTALSAMVVLTC